MGQSMISVTSVKRVSLQIYTAAAWLWILLQDVPEMVLAIFLELVLLSKSVSSRIGCLRDCREDRLGRATQWQSKWKGNLWEREEETGTCF